MNVLIVAALLALPVYAGLQSGADFYWLGIYVPAISAVTYWVYAVDKRRAEQGGWRVPEARLHLLELLGGWPGAFLAQRRLRHKCSKVSYQAGFWLIVLLYQLLAGDSLQHWKYSRAAMNQLERVAHRH